MSTSDLIFVLGVPNGGTSCVAGLLGCLGYDLGRMPHTPGGRRDYQLFECEDFAVMVQRACTPWLEQTPKSAPGVAVDAIRGYVRWRRAKAGPFARLACKHFGLSWAALSPDFWRLDGIRCVTVHRPFDACRRGWYRRTPGKTTEQMLNQVGYLLSVYASLFELRGFEPPKQRNHHIEYDELVTNPGDVVMSLAAYLGGDIPAENIERAIAFVRPREVHAP